MVTNLSAELDTLLQSVLESEGEKSRFFCFGPYPTLCRYYVNRDTLFCYHKASEAFLQRLMALYVASHYKVRYLTPIKIILIY